MVAARLTPQDLARISPVHLTTCGAAGAPISRSAQTPSTAASGALLCWSLENCTRSERDRLRRHVLICRFGASPRTPAINNQRRTTVWREVTRPARGPKLPISDRQRGAIFLAPPSWRDPLRVNAAGRHRPLAARSRNGQSDEKMYSMSRTPRIRRPLP